MLNMMLQSPEREDEEEEEEEEPQEDEEAIRTECLAAFSTHDYIMEPGVFNMLQKYFKAGGSPEQVVELLSENYKAVAQTANLMAEWLIQAGKL